MTNKKHRIFWCLAIFLIVIALCGITYGKFLSHLKVSEQSYLLIDKDDNIDSVRTKIQQIDGVSMFVFDACVRMSKYSDNIHTGRYRISSDLSTVDLFRNLRNHSTEPLMLVVPSVRTMPEMAGRLARQLMIDSLELVEYLNDTSVCRSLGYSPETLPALFIPNSYEVYWDTSVENLMKRMKRVNEEFWNSQRLEKAEKVGLSPLEVYVLASIIDSETTNNAEKPTVAGLYINRLNKKMLLQSDPTVVFAWGDFTIRRVLNTHLQIDSPYNTYKYVGLPPGPIRVASIAGIDAVLNYEKHDYIFMCAKEDFSGTHNFAVNGAQHAANARKYQIALNQRGIKR